MTTPVLDHLVLDVHGDMEATAALYRHLGFTLTDRGYHTLGSINHLAIFATDYLELLGWPETGTGRAELRDFPRGLNGLVFKTDDADATYAHLQSVGLASAPPRAFSRPLTIDGTSHDAKFRTVSVDPARARLGRIYFCEHLTPDLVWRPEWQHHANGVTAIDAVTISSPDPAAMADVFRAMFGDVIHQHGERYMLTAGRPSIEIVPAPVQADIMSTLRLSGRAAAPVDAAHIRLEFVAQS